MTIGLAILLKNTAILVADGRKSDISNQENMLDNQIKIINDDNNKIEEITKNLALIHFGIEEVTKKTAKSIQEKAKFLSSPETTLQVASSCIENEWHSFVKEKKGHLNENKKENKAGLIIAGISNNELFIGGKLIGFSLNDKYSLESSNNQKNIKLFMLGGRANIAEEILSNKLLENLNRSYLKFECNETSEVINLTLKCAGETIREEEKHCLNIGGVIRYAAFSNDGEYVKGMLSI